MDWLAGRPAPPRGGMGAASSPRAAPGARVIFRSGGPMRFLPSAIWRPPRFESELAASLHRPRSRRHLWILPHRPCSCRRLRRGRLRRSPALVALLPLARPDLRPDPPLLPVRPPRGRRRPARWRPAIGCSTSAAAPDGTCRVPRARRAVVVEPSSRCGGSRREGRGALGALGAGPPGSAAPTAPTRTTQVAWTASCSRTPSA